MWIKLRLLVRLVWKLGIYSSTQAFAVCLHFLHEFGILACLHRWMNEVPWSTKPTLHLFEVFMVWKCGRISWNEHIEALFSPLMLANFAKSRLFTPFSVPQKQCHRLFWLPIVKLKLFPYSNRRFPKASWQSINRVFELWSLAHVSELEEFEHFCNYY